MDIHWGYDMRYLVQKEFEKEITARRRFLYDCFGIWMYVGRPEKDFIPLLSMPDAFQKDVLFLYGHNNAVNRYLVENQDSISEQTVILITCQASYKFERYGRKDRKIYIARQENNTVKIYDKEDYCFDFDPCDSELICYNLKKGNVLEMIERAFVCISEGDVR